MKMWEVTWIDQGMLWRRTMRATDLYSVLATLPSIGPNVGTWNVVKIEQVNRVGEGAQ